MAYTVELSDDAQKDLSRLDKSVARRIIERLQWLQSNASTISHQALTGPLAGLYKLRAGDYRIVYRMEHEVEVIVVEFIGHRSDVYK